jgi:hypothetical protein
MFWQNCNVFSKTLLNWYLVRFDPSKWTCTGELHVGPEYRITKNCFTLSTGQISKTNNFLITKILEGLRRKRVKSSDVRAPVTLDHLRRHLQALQKVCTSNYEVCLFSSAFTLAWRCLRKWSNVTGARTSLDFTLFLRKPSSIFVIKKLLVLSSNPRG